MGHVMPFLRALLDCWPYFLISFGALVGATKANSAITKQGGTKPRFEYWRARIKDKSP
eukprot:CAMPEP_0119499284 /NCGR_PEP_ID=MMETSP1344-20130328/21798_1 /TAXON_ID=236787 /ORGANISM="Florenciella parvula, Strain CCMP2471" /LENGTH=57 /DNA_ID=CAMNT_0007535261 /DNA_START=1 /DNA_END=170 /DNA_ORIENTATION=+